MHETLSSTWLEYTLDTSTFGWGSHLSRRSSTSWWWDNGGSVSTERRESIITCGDTWERIGHVESC
jgi:hypothetical protein